MSILHNRFIAGVLALLIVAVSSVVGVGVTLGALRAQTQAVFTLGTQGVPGIQSDLGEIVAQAFNLTQIASRYLQTDYPAVASVLERRDALQRASTPREKNRAAEELVASVVVLRHTLEGLELSAQDQNLMSMVVVEINSRLVLIGNNPYNSAALGFNQKLERFPANILGRIAGIRPLELYE